MKRKGGGGTLAPIKEGGGYAGIRSNRFNQQRRAQTEGERRPGVGLGARFKRPK